MEPYEKLLLENKAWAKEVNTYNPSFFKLTGKSQAPEFLWIGCSDSRVSSGEITNTYPGQMFVHRNIANMAISDDLSMLSVVQYAVEVLKVSHVIVCGHENCGGIIAALEGKKMGKIDGWLAHIKKVYLANKAEVDACRSQQEKINLMVELNVKQQIMNLMQTESISKAWKTSQSPELHGWVYGLSTGLITEVVNISPKNAQTYSPLSITL